MLRGTNRSIIEINETENKFFEKILIFVKPEFGSLPPETLSKEANKVIYAMNSVPLGMGRITARKRAKLRLRRKVTLLAATLIIAAATIVLIKLL